jgi:ketosteroid isomerase-like protein
MMAPSPIEVFQEALHAIQSGEVQAWLDLCSDDVVFEFPFAPPGRPVRVEGKQALGEYLAAVPSRVEFDRLSNLETHQTLNPDVAIFEVTAAGRVKDTGAPYEMSYVVVLTVRDGRIAHYRDYWNPLKALSVETEA